MTSTTETRSLATNSSGYTFERTYDCLFKIIIIGDAATGKSSCLTRFTHGIFPDTSETIGVDFFFHEMNMDGKKIKLQAWDTAGQDRFKSIIRSYYRGANAVVYTYDVTSMESLEHLESVWMEETDKYMSDGAMRMIIGNKSDHQFRSAAVTQRAAEMAQKYTIPHFIVSAKTGENITQAFTDLTRRCLEQAIENNHLIQDNNKKLHILSQSKQGAHKVKSPSSWWMCNIL
eukprot:m.3676 g.3676  ORF g.3676 m.3676 type:complete len:231 (+) comp3708_c0_seq1:408-1100(+)